MTGRKDFERKAFSDEGMPSVEYAQSLLDMNNNQRRELARLNAKCDALAARLAEAERLLRFVTEHSNARRLLSDGFKEDVAIWLAGATDSADEPRKTYKHIITCNACPSTPIGEGSCSCRFEMP